MAPPPSTTRTTRRWRRGSKIASPAPRAQIGEHCQRCIGVIGAVPLVAGLALVTRRIRLAAYAALAGGTIYLVAKLVKAFVQRGRPQTLLGTSTSSMCPTGAWAMSRGTRR